MRKIYLLSISLLATLVVFGQDTKPKQLKQNPIVFEKVNLQMPPVLNAPGCDTLLWSPTTISQYGGTAYVVDDALPLDSGIISGVNAFNDRQKGNYFDVSGSSNSNYVTKVRFAFGRAKSSDMSKTIFFRVYDIGATDIVLAGSSAAITLSSLTGVIGGVADYTFPTPIPLSSKRFIISVDYSNLSFAANDSFFVFQNSYATSLNAPDSAVEQWSDGSWQFMSDGGHYPYYFPPTFVYLFPYVSNNTGCTLPVTLGELTGSSLGATNTLKWTTKTEIGNKGFEIQRSPDGVAFTKLDFVESKAFYGNSVQVINYEYADNSPNATTNYYRIKQIDQNGKISFSNIALLNRSLDKLKGILTYYPNPVKTGLNLQLAATQAGNNIISVVNMSGVVVLQQSLYTTGSLQTVSLNVANLPKGTYIVRLNGENKTAKFVKE